MFLRLLIFLGKIRCYFMNLWNSYIVNSFYLFFKHITSCMCHKLPNHRLYFLFNLNKHYYYGVVNFKYIRFVKAFLKKKCKHSEMYNITTFLLFIDLLFYLAAGVSNVLYDKLGSSYKYFLFIALRRIFFHWK